MFKWLFYTNSPAVPTTKILDDFVNIDYCDIYHNIELVERDSWENPFTQSIIKMQRWVRQCQVHQQKILWQKKQQTLVNLRQFTDNLVPTQISYYIAPNIYYNSGTRKRGY